jgi:hypothetical protein
MLNKFHRANLSFDLQLSSETHNNKYIHSKYSITLLFNYLKLEKCQPYNIFCIPGAVEDDSFRMTKQRMTEWRVATRNTRLPTQFNPAELNLLFLNIF